MQLAFTFSTVSKNYIQLLQVLLASITSLSFDCEAVHLSLIFGWAGGYEDTVLRCEGSQDGIPLHRYHFLPKAFIKGIG
jgi:hypothetical protein